MVSRKLVISRYLPAFLVAGCAVSIGIHTWQTGDPGTTEGKPAPGPTLIKSPYRELREQQTAAQRPLHRKPILPADTTVEPLSVEEAQRMVAEAREFTGRSSRGRVAAEVITRLCAADEVDAAFALIEPETSDARNAGLKAFFQSANLDEATILLKISEFTRPVDASNALAAYLHRVPFNALEGFVARHPELHPFLKQGLTESLETRLSGPDHGRALAMADSFHGKGLVDDKLVLQKIMEDTTRSPFLRWNELNQRISRNSPHFNIVANDLIEKMTEVQPVTVANWALDSSKKIASGHSNYTLRRVLSLWAQKDQTSALDWFHKNSPEITTAQQDDIAWAFAINADASGKNEEAAQWLAQVGDPETRKRLNRLLKPTGSKDRWD